MEELDDYTNYPGRRAIMEAQAELVQAYWESNLDVYDRQEMNSLRPNISCSVELPSYFYIPNELYYSFGPQLVKEIRSSGGMEAVNAALYELPTSEQIYSPEKYFEKETPLSWRQNDLIKNAYKKHLNALSEKEQEQHNV